MIVFIANEILEDNKRGVDLWTHINPDLMQDGSMKKYLENYLVLTHFPEKFLNETPLMIYYNRYYWFSKFYNRYLELHSDDRLNLRQQEFKIIEDGEKFTEIDWELIEQISLKGKFSRK